MTVLVTGANGFVGATLVAHLRDKGGTVRAATRRAQSVDDDTALAPDLGPAADWRPALAGVETVIHCAARVHVMKDTAADPLAAFRAANVEGTRALAEQAADAGAKRLVFLSSIKVNGEAAPPDHPFTASDPPAPQDPYGQSKAEAEDALRAIAAHTGLEVVILRPPLIYGPGVKGNMAALMRAVAKGLPLPLGAVTGNYRSLIGLGNLVSALALLARHPDAAGRTFLIRDGEDLSTADLVRRIGRAMSRPARLVPVPLSLLSAPATLLGKGAAIRRLTGSLVVDDGPLRALGWTPPHTVDDGLAAMARPIDQA